MDGYPYEGEMMMMTRVRAWNRARARGCVCCHTQLVFVRPQTVPQRATATQGVGVPACVCRGSDDW